MKIILTLDEALEYIRDHEYFEALTEAEFVIEGFEPKVEEPKEEAPVEEEAPKPKRKRRRKAKPEEDVTQEQIDKIVVEVDKELQEELKEEINATIPQPSETETGESSTDTTDTSTVVPDAVPEVNEEAIVDEIVSSESSEESESQTEPTIASDVLDEGINVPVSDEPSLFDAPVEEPSLFPQDEAETNFEDSEMSLIDEVLAETGDDEAFEPTEEVDIFDVSIPYEEREAYAKANGLVPPLF
jgi:hypothetical protein